MRKRFRRPSASMIVAMTALVMAFTGPALADQAASIAKKINGKNLKSKSITGSKLKNNTITGTQVKESKLGKVPSASKADTAGNADTVDGVDSSALARKGESAPPLAYAKVNDDGTLDTANSKGVIDSTMTTPPGRYCFKLGFTPHNMVASAERFVGASNSVVAQPAVTATITAVCPAGYQDAGVFVFDNTGSLVNNRFFIIFN